MIDNREAIIARLVDVAVATEKFVEVFRNVVEFPDTAAVPACAILEGDEEASDSDPQGRGSKAPRIVQMAPQVVIYAGNRVEEIGEDLNELRSAVIDAILTDTTLRSLSANGLGARYIGMDSDLAFGRQMLGRMALNFSIQYPLLPTA